MGFPTIEGFALVAAFPSLIRANERSSPFFSSSIKLNWAVIETEWTFDGKKRSVVASLIS